MDISGFLSSLGDKIGKLFGSNPFLDNFTALKTAIILIAISLLISSLALLILALSHHGTKKASKHQTLPPSNTLK